MNEHTRHCVIAADGLLVHVVPKNASYAMTKAFSEARTERTGPAEPAHGRERFMCVRHPLDRLVSAWAFFLHTPDAPRAPLINDNLPEKAPFTDFLAFALDHIDADRHLIPQADYHGPHDFTCVRFEHLGTAWEGLCARHAFIKPLAHLHRSAPQGDWREHYTLDMRVRAEAAYSQDMDLYEKGMKP